MGHFFLKKQKTFANVAYVDSEFNYWQHYFKSKHQINAKRVWEWG